MKRVKILLIVVLGSYLLTGCGASSPDGTATGKSISTQAQQPQSGSVARITDIRTEPVKDKPEVTRVVLTLDKKASYSTSRQGEQLIVNVFNANMKSAMQHIDVKDGVVESVAAKQVGNSIKSTIELVDPDIAYTPSTSTDPYQIIIDVWQISQESALLSSSESKEETVIPQPVQNIEVATSPPTASDAASETRVKEVTVDIRPSSESPPQTSEVTSPQTTSSSAPPSSQDVPTQLRWFSEKLSQVLQEQEAVKQELLEAEKTVAAKDSMLQVLERKLQEANTRNVSLEEDLIKARSKVSLAEQNEEEIWSQLQELLGKLEEASGEQSVPATGPAEQSQLQTRAQKIISKLTSLQQQSLDLVGAKTELAQLREQVVALEEERDELQTKAQNCTEEVAQLRERASRLAAVEQELSLKKQELARLRNAIGAAARLVVQEPSSPVTIQPAESSTPPVTPTVTVSPAASLTTPQPPSTSEPASSTPQTTGEEDDTQLVLAELLQQQPQALGPEEYILGPEDVVQIRVLKEENLDKTVTVSSDGFITYPLLGDLRVDGLTTAQLDAQITSLLERDFLVDPEVVIDIVKPRSKKVYIMGAVKQPGYHEISEDGRLLGTLLNAGGPVSFNAEVRILRLPRQDIVNDDMTETLPPISADLHKLFVEGDQTQNLLLHDGDVLMVGAKSQDADATGEEGLLASEGEEAQQFYVVGSVVSPGIYPYKEDDTVLDAILRAGGFTEFANRNQTKLVRESGGKTQTKRIKMKDVMEKGEMDENLPIMPGDMIIVPESFF